MKELKFKLLCLTRVLMELSDNLLPEVRKEVFKAMMDLNFKYTIDKDGQVEGPPFKFRGATVDPTTGKVTP